MSVGLMPAGGPKNCRPEHKAKTQWRDSLNVRSAQCHGHSRRQHRTERIGHTPSPRIEIKISDSAGNRTRAAGLEGRDSIDHGVGQ